MYIYVKCKFPHLVFSWFVCSLAGLLSPVCLLVCFLVGLLLGWLAGWLAGWPNLQSRGDKTVDRGQLFGPRRPLFGLYQNLFAPLARSEALRLTEFFVSTYSCEEAFSRMNVITSRSQNRVTDEHSKYCLQLYLSHYKSTFSKLSQDMQSHESTSRWELMGEKHFIVGNCFSFKR
jgi:hypothetical protein